MTSTTAHHHHYWISAGRNRAGTTVPLDSGDWAEFQDALRFYGNLWGSLTGVEVHGTSTWEGESEETFLVLLSTHEGNVAPLKAALARTAAAFDQEAVGFVGGPGESLVTA